MPGSRATVLPCLLLSSCAAFAATGTTAPASAPSATLEIATWNLEWLIAPEAMRELRRDCAGERGRAGRDARRIPCEVGARFDRSRADFAALARYARKLDADVIALQEVDGPRAAALVFPGHSFCFTGRRDVQNTGFAIRAGIPHRCGPDWRALSLGDRVRRGAELVLFPDEPREIRLLGVHLKSGCGSRLLDAPRAECADLARQAAALENWIDGQARAGRRFVVLGDFNRDLLRERGGAARSPTGRLQRLWPELDDGEPAEADLRNAAEGERFVNCTAAQAFDGYIDHIVLSRSLARVRVPGSFERITYRTDEHRRLRLADHCPVAVRIRLD
jgi:endonuclease/exonuclease/phosphatase family metal-dependent hydrolase